MGGWSIPTQGRGVFCPVAAVRSSRAESLILQFPGNRSPLQGNGEKSTANVVVDEKQKRDLTLEDPQKKQTNARARFESFLLFPATPILAHSSESAKPDHNTKLWDFTRLALSSCRSMWAQFNPLSRILGLVLFSTSLVATHALYIGILRVSSPSTADPHSPSHTANWEDWLTFRLWSFWRVSEAAMVFENDLLHLYLIVVELGLPFSSAASFAGGQQSRENSSGSTRRRVGRRGKVDEDDEDEGITKARRTGLFFHPRALNKGDKDASAEDENGVDKDKRVFPAPRQHSKPPYS
ncbi:hypothetical protein C8R42DRAFT_742756 [Lentinula raphanica]|nr:hypothetical protein C8R42DRAFT_742756 [Lentinula raphanica]